MGVSTLETCLISRQYFHCLALALRCLGLVSRDSSQHLTTDEMYVNVITSWLILSLNSLYSFWSHLSLGVCRWPETVERIRDVVLVSAKMKFTYCFVHNVCSWIVLLCFYSLIVCKIKTVSCLERLFSESWSCVHWTVTFSSWRLLSWSHDPCQKMSLNYWKLAPLSLKSCKYNCR